MIFGTENKERNICCSYIHERIYISDEGRTGSGNKSKEKEKEAKKNTRRQPRVDVSYVEHTHTHVCAFLPLKNARLNINAGQLSIYSG